MPRPPTQSGQKSVMSIPMIITLFVLAIIGVFVLAAGFTFGIGGVFWSSLGVIGVIIALIVIFIFVGLPVLILLLAMKGAQSIGS